MNEPVLARLNQLMRVREEVETLAGTGPWTPPADWIESGTHLTLLLDVPGVSPDTLEVSDDSGEQINVRGERSTPDLPGQMVARERPAGVFTRTLVPPAEIVPGTGEATLQAGVLTLRFEKRHKTIDQDAR